VFSLELYILLSVGKTIPRWRTAAILKIIISPYLSKKSSDFDEILYTAADFELDERQVIKNEKVALDQRDGILSALDRLRVRQNVFLVQYHVHVTVSLERLCVFTTSWCYTNSTIIIVRLS